VSGLFLVALVGSIVAWFEKDELSLWVDSSWTFAKQILPLLLGGVLVAGFLLGGPGGSERGIIPNEWIAQAVGGNSVLANFAASFVGAFMYFATLTEVPILEGLIRSGMGKGPALALLLAGPALSLPNMLVIRSVMGTKKTLVFVTLVIVLSTLAGMVYGALFLISKGASGRCPSSPRARATTMCIVPSRPGRPLGGRPGLRQVRQDEQDGRHRRGAGASRAAANLGLHAPRNRRARRRRRGRAVRSEGRSRAPPALAGEERDYQILVLSCGAGLKCVRDTLPGVRIVPGLDTLGPGVKAELACLACGRCEFAEGGCKMLRSGRGAGTTTVAGYPQEERSNAHVSSGSNSSPAGA
jgi:hypothetical protein